MTQTTVNLSPQQKRNELPQGTLCQWCYSPIEKGEDYTKDSIYGYVHRDDNEFCVRTQEKVDRQCAILTKQYTVTGVAPVQATDKITPLEVFSKLFSTFFNEKG